MTFNAKRNVRSLDCMKSIRSASLWIVWNVRIGRLAPALMAFALRAKRFSKESNDSK
mgnify:CR=1 FL=1